MADSAGEPGQTGSGRGAAGSGAGSAVDKIVTDIDAAVADIAPGSTIAVGGFGTCGVPRALLAALRRAGVGELSVVSNNGGTEDDGVGPLVADGLVRRVTGSFIGGNAEVARRYLSGELEVELVPQGTLAERLRAGGAGIPAFYTATGIGTLVAEGGLPLRYGPDGTVASASAPKEIRVIGGRTYLLEEALACDVALVRAARADRYGNCTFHLAARNFNPLCAMAGRLAIVEAEEIVPVGGLHPDEVHLPGAFVQRVVPVPAGTPKPIEQRRVRQEPAVAEGRG